jgi:hypothetical protein
MKRKINDLNYLLIAATLLFSFTLRAQWNQVGSDIDGEAEGDLSGSSISMSANGGTFATGAPHNDGNGTYTGNVRVYKWNGIIWVQLGNDIDGEADGDQSGYSLSISSNGEMLAIGTTYNGGNGFIAGHVRIYSWNGLIWTQLGNDIDGELAGDQSGWSVSMSDDGETLAIGSISSAGNGTEAGHVRIFSWNGANWIQRGNNINGEAANDQSGWSVSLSSDGETLAIGAPKNDDNGNDAGQVRVFKWNGTSWMKMGNDIDGEAADDWSGESVSISADGKTVAIGASGNDRNGTDAGHVRIYYWNGIAWNKLGNDIYGEATDDLFGYSVSLSADGKTAAIGAPGNDGNGSNAGQVKIYNWNGTSWIQVGNNIYGEAAEDRSGGAVSISSDDGAVAIGAIYNVGNGTDAGHVRVLSVNGITNSVIENKSSETLVVYPNPTTGHFSIDLGSHSNNATLSITNVLGKVIYSTKIAQAKILHLKLDEPAGVYIVTIQSDNKKVVGQIILE